MLLNFLRIALDAWIFATLGSIFFLTLRPGFVDERAGNIASFGLVVFVVGLTTLRVFQRRRVAREAKEREEQSAIDSPGAAPEDRSAE